jgi:hypothetical protein
MLLWWSDYACETLLKASCYFWVMFLDFCNNVACSLLLLRLVLGCFASAFEQWWVSCVSSKWLW